MSPSRQHFTRRVTFSATLKADSIGLVVAKVRRSSSGTPRRMTVSASSYPLPQAGGGVGVQPFQPADRCLQAFPGRVMVRFAVSRMELPGKLVPGFSGRCSSTFRRLWTWQRWMRALSPQTRFTAACRAFEPSNTKKRRLTGVQAPLL